MKERGTPRRGLKQKRHQPSASEILKESYWIQTEAINIFGEDESGSASGVILKRINLLQNVGKTPDGWRIVIDNGDEHNSMTDYQKFTLVQRCQYLILALQHDLENMNKKIDC